MRLRSVPDLCVFYQKKRVYLQGSARHDCNAILNPYAVRQFMPRSAAGLSVTEWSGLKFAIGSWRRGWRWRRGCPTETPSPAFSSTWMIQQLMIQVFRILIQSLQALNCSTLKYCFAKFFTNHKYSTIHSYLRCVQEVLVVPLLKMRRECSAVGCQVELQVSMTTMQQMNYKCDPDAFYLEQTINR